MTEIPNSAHPEPVEGVEGVKDLLAFTPVPRLKARSNGWSPEVQRDFIKALAATGSVRSACRRVRRSDHGAYALRHHPEAGEFCAAWDAAAQFGIRRIEDAATDRALNGVEERIFYHGDLVGTRVRHDERLVMFMLRNRAPERFAAGGGARALTAVDETRLARLKAQWQRQWRHQWEAEQEAAAKSPAEIRESIERKVAAVKREVLARTSPRAFEHQLALVAQTRADEAAGWRPGFPYAEFAAKAAELLPQFIEQVRAEYPPHPEYQWSDADRRTHGAPPLLAAPDAPRSS